MGGSGLYGTDAAVISNGSDKGPHPFTL